MSITPRSILCEVTLVEAPACHLCDDARAVLEELSVEYPLSMRVLDINSAEGLALVAAHRPAMNPLILVDGEFFSAGRLPRGKLLKRLRRQSEQRLWAEP
jgi:hypothetical protein